MSDTPTPITDQLERTALACAMPWPDECRKLERMCAELAEELKSVNARYQWSANELLTCDYGDNDSAQHGTPQIGWRIWGWRIKRPLLKWTIYGESIDKAIDVELSEHPIPEKYKQQNAVLARYEAMKKGGE